MVEIVRCYPPGTGCLGYCTMTQIDPVRFVLSCVFGPAKSTLFTDIGRYLNGPR